MIRLFLLYAILIFAKKAPQLIKDLLNIKGDNIGLKGLNIKNKMGEAALVGKHVKKGMTGIEGGIKKGLGSAVGGLKGGFTKGLGSGTLKDKLKNGTLKNDLKNGIKEGATGIKKGFAGGIISGAREGALKGDTKGMLSGSYKDTRGIASGGAPTFWDNRKAQLAGLTSKISAQGFSSFEISNQKDFEKLRKRLVDMYGMENANKMIGSLGNINFAKGSEYDKTRKLLKGWTEAYDNSKLVDSSGRAIGVDISSDADSRFVKQNILDGRDKLFEKLRGYDQQIESTMQSLNPLTQQMLVQQTAAQAQLSAVTDQLNSISTQKRDLRKEIILDPDRKTEIETQIAVLEQQEASLIQQKNSYNSQISSYDLQIRKDKSYQQAMDIIDSYNAKKEKVFKDAFNEGLLKENEDLGIKKIKCEKIDPADPSKKVLSLSEFYAGMEDASKANSKALAGVTKEIEESGKDSTPASKSDK